MVIKGLFVSVWSVTFDLSYDKAAFLSGKNTWKHITFLMQII